MLFQDVIQGYLLVANVTFLFLAVVWDRSNFLNIFLKMLFFVMTAVGSGIFFKTL